MKALILAAGYATRLYPLTKDTPKPLLDLGGRAIIDYIIDKIKTVKAINEVVIVSNNKFYSQFNEWLSRKPKDTLKYRLVNDGSNTVEDRLGAVGDINLSIKECAIDDDLLIVAGDNLFDFSLNDFILFARKNSPYHAICLYRDDNEATDLTRFGIAQVDSNSLVTDFQEKPKSPKSRFIATCIYFIPKQKIHLINNYMGQGNYNDTPGSYIKWLTKHDRVYGNVCKGTWFDLGDLEALKEASQQVHSMNHK
ncbi:MAG: nucleotidyltransferase family protein [Candidatus Omnitrophota bacterium]|jgi:glucose-1-phosphate thymidylyltransferase